ncbi:regulatory protein GemA [Xanthobacter autotrophicus]|uniref:regulatory protein GemA n=1 Tax=Xanthobacter autotrophicus TaxID=280 RepID=UPI00372B744F
MTAASTAQIRAIHTISRRVGLDEGQRRDLIAAATGKRSSADLTMDEGNRVISRLRDLEGGAPAAAAKGARKMEGRYAPKLLALWISGWHLGVVKDRTDKALLSFVERMTGIQHTRFLQDADAARKVIEALKAWLAREAGVDWPARGASDDVRENKFAVLFAQRRCLTAAGADMTDKPTGAGMTEAEIDAEIRDGGALLRRLLKGGSNGR